MGICTHRTLLVGVVAALLLTGQSIRAHEIGTTRVSVVFAEPDRYEFEIVTDALTLLEKLEGVSGESGSPVLDTSMLRKRLEHLEPIFRQRVVIAFDDQVVRPAISWSVTQADTVGGALSLPSGYPATRHARLSSSPSSMRGRSRHTRS